MTDEARPPSGRALSDYVTMQEAADILGVSRFQMSSVVKRLKLKVFETPADRRRRLLLREEVERLAQPRPKAKAAQPGKQAPPSLPAPWLQHGVGAAL